MRKRRSQEILLSKTFLNTIKTKFNEEYLGLYNIDSESDEYTKIYDVKFAFIMDKLDKYKYRAILYEIESNRDIYSEMNLSHELIFIHIEIKCIINIIEKKYRDYKENAYSKGVEKWLIKLENKLDYYSNEIENLDLEQQKNQYEYLNYYYLIMYYYYAFFEKLNNNILDSLSYLLLAEKIIKETLEQITFHEIYRIIVKIYLLLITFYMIDKNFFTALNYIIALLELCYKDLDYIFLSKQKKEENIIDNNITNDILFIIIICFYYSGCIFEEFNNIDICTHCYFQTYSLSNNFFKDKYFYLNYLFKGIKKRYKNHIKILSIISKFESNLLNESDNKKELIIKNKKKKYYVDKKKNRLKFVEKFINKLKIKEIDDDEKDLFSNNKRIKFKKSMRMMKQVFLLDYLTSDEFKPTIKKLDNLEINNINDDTKNIIQKQIITIKSNQKLKNNSNEVTNQKINKNNLILISPPKKTKLFHQIYKKIPNNKYNYSNLNYKPKNNNTNSLTNYYKSVNNSYYNKIYNKYNTNLNSNSNSYSYTFNDRPLKINYDKYIFNKDYIKKRNFLELQSDKEYQFQKEILKGKKNEHIFIRPFDIESSKNKAENFFNLTVDERLKSIEERNKSIKSEEKKRYFRSILGKQESFLFEKSCKSLSTKDSQKYFEFVKRIAKRNKMKNKIYFFNSDNSSDTKYESNKRNKEVISLLELNITNIEKKELKLKKNKSDREMFDFKNKTLLNKTKKPFY